MQRKFAGFRKGFPPNISFALCSRYQLKEGVEEVLWGGPFRWKIREKVIYN